MLIASMSRQVKVEFNVTCTRTVRYRCNENLASPSRAHRLRQYGKHTRRWKEKKAKTSEKKNWNYKASVKEQRELFTWNWQIQYWVLRPNRRWHFVTQLHIEYHCKRTKEERSKCEWNGELRWQVSGRSRAPLWTEWRCSAKRWLNLHLLSAS